MTSTRLPGKVLYEVMDKPLLESGLSNIYTPELDEDMDEDKGKLEFPKYGNQLADDYCGLYCGNWDLETSKTPVIK